MAIITGNQLETIEIGSSAWRVICNDNFQKTVTEYKLNNGIDTDIKINDENKGLILKDRTTGDYYRLYVDNGNLQIEKI